MYLRDPIRETWLKLDVTNKRVVEDDSQDFVLFWTCLPLFLPQLITSEMKDKVCIFKSKLCFT